MPSSSVVGEEIGRTISKSVTDEMGKGGTKSADAFGTSFRKRMKAALDALPDAEIDANSSKADKKVAELRKRMEAMLGKEIGDDLSSKDAMKELALIDTGLEEVRSKSKDIRITFDTKEARAQLALLVVDARGHVLARAPKLFSTATVSATVAAGHGATPFARGGWLFGPLAGAAAAAALLDGSRRRGHIPP